MKKRTHARSWHATITSGEPQLGGEDGFAPQSYETDHHWNVDTRPAWQRHSELGPNLDAEAKRKAPPEAMQETVNPTDFDWHAAGSDVDVNALRSTYDQMLATEVMRTQMRTRKLNTSMTTCSSSSFR